MAAMAQQLKAGGERRAYSLARLVSQFRNGFVTSPRYVRVLLDTNVQNVRTSEHTEREVTRCLNTSSIKDKNRLNLRGRLSCAAISSEPDVLISISVRHGSSAASETVLGRRVIRIVANSLDDVYDLLRQPAAADCGHFRTIHLNDYGEVFDN